MTTTRALGVYLAGTLVVVVSVILVLNDNRWLLLLPATALVVVAVRHPRIAASATGVALPFSGGLALTVGGFFVAIADILAMLTLVVLWAHRGNPSTAGGALRATSAVLWLFVPYVLVSSLQVAAFHDASTFLTVVQRIEIVVVWTLLGATLLQSSLLRPFLNGYVASTLLMSAAWLATPGVAGIFGTQKNPSGGFIAVSILLVVLSRHRWRIPVLALLTAGLIATGSRGSFLGLAIGGLTLVLLVHQWKRVILPLALAATAGGLALYALPPSFTERFLAAGDGYTDQIRKVFVADALQQLAQQPEGVGVGNYRQVAMALQRVETRDPHNVLVLNLVEGSWPLLASFLLLVIGTLVAVIRGVRSPLVAAAVAIQVSTLSHALLDVYWVRGTPAPGWLLIGASLALLGGSRRHTNATQNIKPRNYRRLARAQTTGVRDESVTTGR